MEIYNNTIIGHNSDFGITSRGFDGDCWNNHFESVNIPYMRYDNNWVGTIRDEKVKFNILFHLFFLLGYILI